LTVTPFSLLLTSPKLSPNLLQISVITSTMLALFPISLLTVFANAVASSYPASDWVLMERNEPATAVTHSLQGPFDGPKFEFFNSTVYQWWYLDIVSSILDSSVAVEFQVGSELALGLGNLSEILIYVSVSGKFPNGTLFDVAAISANNITIQTVGQGSSGIRIDSGCSWTGTPDLSQYSLTLDAPAFGVHGTILLNSVSI
jgi:hypothetical protein